MLPAHDEAPQGLPSLEAELLAREVVGRALAPGGGGGGGGGGGSGASAGPAATPGSAPAEDKLPAPSGPPAYKVDIAPSLGYTYPYRVGIGLNDGRTQREREAAEKTLREALPQKEAVPPPGSTAADADVRRRLRAQGEPVSLYAETDEQRRERNTRLEAAASHRGGKAFRQLGAALAQADPASPRGFAQLAW